MHKREQCPLGLMLHSCVLSISQPLFKKRKTLTLNTTYSKCYIIHPADPSLKIAPDYNYTFTPDIT